MCCLVFVSAKSRNPVPTRRLFADEDCSRLGVSCGDSLHGLARGGPAGQSSRQQQLVESGGRSSGLPTQQRAEKRASKMISSDNVSGRTMVVAAVAAAGAAVLGVVVARKLLEDKRDKCPAESAWRRVGTVTTLHVFPLKSGRPVETDKLVAGEAGPTLGILRDRSFVAVDRTGRAVTGRTHPGLLTVSISPATGKEGAVELRSTLVDKPLILDISQLKALKGRKIAVWKCTVSGVDCGDEAADFIRKAAVTSAHPEGSAAAELRLAFFPWKGTDRSGPIKRSRGVFGIFTDETSYHLIVRSSVDALNEKLEVPVRTLNFRPNFVVEGPAAFDEDAWQYVRIGQVVFKMIHACGRCMLTTVDPDTGIKSPTTEPLTTLRKFRHPTPEQRALMPPSDGHAPVMGIMLGVVKQGEIFLNDAVYAYP
ncbi:mitochondrial amidoxime reducing component 2-like [Thrips palmi]|uniref:Mitochondrial amidoxime reducing component 2-like n=1 Tax=Thrips palmi TaxID=161013 RepID=A0A6P8ZXG5_THRPL|nr:mitochondrial amidoxime reducing component 2-like [Thrips palmi]